MHLEEEYEHRNRCTQQNLFQRQSSLFAAGREQLMEGERMHFKMEEEWL